MGAWGIKALESDVGLDALGFIKNRFLSDKTLNLDEVINQLNQDSWNRPDDSFMGYSHSSPMVVAEIVMAYVNDDLSTLTDKRFKDITSFTTSKESLNWISNYLNEVLSSALNNSEIKWGGWFKEQDWVNWQEHMKYLIDSLSELATSTNDIIELVPSQHSQEQIMEVM